MTTPCIPFWHQVAAWSFVLTTWCFVLTSCCPIGSIPMTRIERVAHGYNQHIGSTRVATCDESDSLHERETLHVMQGDLLHTPREGIVFLDAQGQRVSLASIETSAMCSMGCSREVREYRVDLSVGRYTLVSSGLSVVGYLEVVPASDNGLREIEQQQTIGSDEIVDQIVDPNQCRARETRCDNACLDLRTDTQHCGSCEQSCQGGHECLSGQCICTGGTRDCSGTCVDVTSDAANCGVCGHACNDGQVCSLAQCSCPSGTMTCRGTCTEVAADSQNCGRCGNRCGEGMACNNGQCRPTYCYNDAECTHMFPDMHQGWLCGFGYHGGAAPPMDYQPPAPQPCQSTRDCPESMACRALGNHRVCTPACIPCCPP